MSPPVFTATIALVKVIVVPSVTQMPPAVNAAELATTVTLVSVADEYWLW